MRIKSSLVANKTSFITRAHLVKAVLRSSKAQIRRFRRSEVVTLVATHEVFRYEGIFSYRISQRGREKDITGIIKSDKSFYVRQEHDHISDYRRRYL